MTIRFAPGRALGRAGGRGVASALMLIIAILLFGMLRRSRGAVGCSAPAEAESTGRPRSWPDWVGFLSVALLSLLGGDGLELRPTASSARSAARSW